MIGRHRVTVGVPVYNGEEFLAECIQSLLAQTRPPDQIIIADNASTDSSLEIAHRFAAEPTVEIVANETNVGAAPNFNRLVDLADGDLFAWLPADDTWSSDLLAAQVRALNDPTVVCAFGDLAYIDSESAVSGRPDPVDWTDSPHPESRVAELLAANEFRSHLHVCGPVLGLVRRDQLLRSGRIRPFGGSDKALIVELALHGRLTPVAPVIYRRQHPESSVVANPDDDSRRTWFDPSLKGPATPTLSLLRAMLGATRNAPLNRRQRAAVTAEIGRWSGRGHRPRVLAGELRRRVKWQSARRVAALRHD